jgi:phosphatidylserine decarboxylase
MAITPPQSPPPSAATIPAGVQPGGAGVCVQVELAWARMRRGLLRRFCPGYVQRMAEKRRGLCPDCPHDIIDSRDLKFCRNVCGYWFRAEDDSFAWRDHIGLARTGLAEVVLCTLLFLGLGAAAATGAILWRSAVWIAFAGLTVAWLWMISFFRDPKRAIPTDPAALVSPADGTVTHAAEVDDPTFPTGRAFRISIFLSIFNVHINRVPRSGRVLGVRYFRGAFLDARHPECPVRNEQLWIDIDEKDSNRLVRVKQISGAIARRIVCWLKSGDEVQAGDRFGMIKFGSRTEVLVPADGCFDVMVRAGDKVKGGSTVLLRFLGEDSSRKETERAQG